jgi:hypothetical protein
MIDEEKRKIVHNKSKEIGHCVCMIKATCPCRFFINNNICHCAGEKHNETMEEWQNYNLENN